MTKQQLKNKRAELEQWLLDNPAHHPNRAQVDYDLREVINQLLQIDNNDKSHSR